MTTDPNTLLEARRFRVVRVMETTADGAQRAREIVRHPGSVTIVPMVDDRHVCLIKNFRVSVGQTLIELPAGTLEPGEDPRLCAERELIEETGYRAAKLELLHEFYLSPGILDECMGLFVATGLTAGDPEREAGEQIENLVVTWDEALAMIQRGEIRDAKTMLGLLYYDRFRTEHGR
jgi:ADP-ribose pyrophosphatase